MSAEILSDLVQDVENAIAVAPCAKQNKPRIFQAADLVVAYLEAAGVEYVYGIPGGNIEPFYNALLRSECRGGPKPVLARHETGAAFMADGYSRNSGKIGVCCATTGPGTTNLITGVSSAYENNTPLLVITAQTALKNFGRKALQDSTDTGINTVGMLQHCTCYNSLVSHVDQLERKLVAAMMAAINHSRPAHLSIPLDVLGASMPVTTPRYRMSDLLKAPFFHDDDAVAKFCRQLEGARSVVFVLGAGCKEAAPLILAVAASLNAKIVTSPDGKGLVSPYHPLYYGVIGYGGHQGAEDVLTDSATELVVAVGTTLGEWQSNGWDPEAILNERLIHIDAQGDNFMHSPMARLQVRGNPVAVFEAVIADLGIVSEKKAEMTGSQLSKRALARPSTRSHLPQVGEDVLQHISRQQPTALIKPKWLMARLTRLFPPETRYLADAGNSMTWAIHYLHPFDRRVSQRRLNTRADEARFKFDKGRRLQTAGLFQIAAEFASMGWAIGASVGAALACPRQPVVCITGDGSMLMSGQEITVALEYQLPIVFIVLNDSSLGMVKHGQRLTGAEKGMHQLPSVNFCAMAAAMGVKGRRLSGISDLVNLTCQDVCSKNGPILFDVLIDPEDVPPMGARVNVLTGLN